MISQIKKFTSNESSLNLTNELAINIKGSPSPFDRNAGFTMSCLSMTRDAPHNGEMHPDGDEAIFVVSGALEITLELDNNNKQEVEVISVNAGEGIVIPQGIWHKVHVIEPAQIVTVSPGPGFEYRDQ